MTTVNQILNALPVNDLNLYKELGDKEIEHGNMDDCIKWYIKGLSKARELKNTEKVSEFSALIYTLL